MKLSADCSQHSNSVNVSKGLSLKMSDYETKCMCAHENINYDFSNEYRKSHTSFKEPYVSAFKMEIN